MNAAMREGARWLVWAASRWKFVLIEVNGSCFPRNRSDARPLRRDAGRCPLSRHAYPNPMIEEDTMGLFTKDIATFDDLFLHQLQDVYFAENQITKALPKMIEKATDPSLKQGFETHLKETEGQIDRLDQVFSMIGEEAKGATCPAIEGIIKEANEVAGDIADKAVLDAALIASAQAVEHYEITRYGTLIAWANQLGKSEVAATLQKTLDEEYATDDKLTQMATSRNNAKAAAVTETA
jgi:ferritin-like metal-binding protein YciE